MYVCMLNQKYFWTAYAISWKRSLRSSARATGHSRSLSDVEGSGKMFSVWSGQFGEGTAVCTCSTVALDGTPYPRQWDSPCSHALERQAVLVDRCGEFLAGSENRLAEN